MEAMEMSKLEKVIKGLEICKPSKYSRTCGICPYREEMNCDYEVYNDALSLLKEQETELCDRCGRRRVKSGREVK